MKNAFLHETIEEEVYMKAPLGFSSDYNPSEGCKLKKTLYGLKKPPRAWFGRFTGAVTKFGYKQSNFDHTLFLNRQNGHITCLIIYVDDMIITVDDKEEICSLKKQLSCEFKMKDLGQLKYFLGIDVLRLKGCIFIS